MGSKVGYLLGLALGDTDGDILGAIDGLELGVAVGLLLGAPVGLALGLALGDALGLAEGASAEHVPSAPASACDVQLPSAPSQVRLPAQSRVRQQGSSVMQGGQSGPPQFNDVSRPSAALLAQPASLGLALGEALGDALGASVGDADGDVDGLIVGHAEGLTDGESLGDALGLRDGLADGLDDGDAVGVSTPHVPRPMRSSAEHSSLASWQLREPRQSPSQHS